MTDITLEQRLRDVLREMDAHCDKLDAIGGGHAAQPIRDFAERIEAALRLSAGADSARLDALEALVDSQPDKALLLHHGQHGINGRYAGLGLSNTRRTLREAIDQAAPRHETGEGQP